jgi:hypothetical protein
VKGTVPFSQRKACAKIGTVPEHWYTFSWDLPKSLHFGRKPITEAGAPKRQEDSWQEDKRRRLFLPSIFLPSCSDL